MKVAVVGSGGRLGAALAREYGDRHDVASLDRAAMDLCDTDRIARVLEELDFEVLVNAAAVTDVDYCETNQGEAFAVNERAVAVMARICGQKGARMIHISTDYVFDGEREGLRTESDPVNPKSVYGRSKLEGEEALLGVSGDFLVVRTSWVFGPDRPSFVDSIVERAMTSERVTAIEDKFSTPTYSLDFVEMLELFLREVAVGGRLNLCNAGACSWREFGQAALDSAAAAGLRLRAAQVGGMGMGDMDQFVASRPCHTAMSVARYEELSGRKVRPWAEAVEAYLRDYLAPRRLCGVEAGQ